MKCNNSPSSEMMLSGAGSLTQTMNPMLIQSGLAVQQQMNSLNSINSVGNKTEEYTKCQFKTREGTYRKLSYPEFTQLPPSFASSTANGNGQCIAPVRCSFFNITNQRGTNELICFNIAHDLYIYTFRGVNKSGDMPKLIEKRFCKSALPTCHQFNKYCKIPGTCLLLIGQSNGQIQLLDINKKEERTFNEENLIDEKKVTCVSWLPNNEDQFLVSHASGNLYHYDSVMYYENRRATYQPAKSGDGYTVYECRGKTTPNLLFRWMIGEGAIHEFAFSPCGKYLATASQDGFLRVFDFYAMELVGRVRSYFGGLLCLCWSPDGRFVVTGGEDDLVTVWSFHERRVVAKGKGHKSWVSVVSFDPYNCGPDETRTATLKRTHENHVNDDDTSETNDTASISEATEATESSFTSPSALCEGGDQLDSNVTYFSYRFGSVGQDTNFCLWDLNDEILRQPMGRSRTSMGPSAFCSVATSPVPKTNGHTNLSTNGTHTNGNGNSLSTNSGEASSTSNLYGTLGNSKNSDTSVKKKHSRKFSLITRTIDKNTLSKASQAKYNEDPLTLLGTSVCPRLDKVPKLEPVICKKISHERLTTLEFRQDCIVTGCQEGPVSTWARPGKWQNNHSLSSPSGSIADDVNDLIDENGSTVV